MNFDRLRPTKPLRPRKRELAKGQNATFDYTSVSRLEAMRQIYALMDGGGFGASNERLEDLKATPYSGENLCSIGTEACGEPMAHVGETARNSGHRDDIDLDGKRGRIFLTT